MRLIVTIDYVQKGLIQYLVWEIKAHTAGVLICRATLSLGYI